MKERTCAAGPWLVKGCALAVLVLVAGCAAKGNVTGKVSYKGKLLPAGTVTFITEKGGATFDAQIQEDGTYTVTKVPAGPAKILVKAYELPKMPARPGPAGQMTGGPPPGALPEGVKSPYPDLKAEAEKVVKIPDKYADAGKSDLTYTVTSGAQTHDIDLQ
jgi:hypothetical protein